MTILTADVHFHDGYSVVHVAGELDVNTTSTLLDAMETALSNRPRFVEIDVAALTFCGSEGLRALLHVQRAALQAGCRLRLCHVHGVLQRVLDVTQLYKAFTIDPVQVPR
ncbi:STAS domain-containing protein [Nonomuraea sp. bgisy101]|uniref:STAS domain-containing protein n=1 Tax=Nonomuraea sp. bgisy101 TaxID=3413784 RepID=UPI003D7503AE